ncbi:MAG TPA: 16S rRNA processing protein RimM [Fastidiosipila sp.]|nr:16S rRNA processing protein RimM [Fastidiosipila sp.]
MIKRFAMFKVVSAHGLKGDLKCFPLSESVDQLAEKERLFISETDEKPVFHLLSVKPSGKFRLVKLAELRSREDAETISGEILYLDRDAAPPPEEGTWFLADLIGFSVYLLAEDERSFVGVMREIAFRPGQDLLVIERKGKNDLFLPAVSAFLKDVDTEKKEIDVFLPEGLTELYD